MKTTTKFWIGIGALVVLSPLGLLLPEHFKSQTAWGEWGTAEIGKLVGYIPAGLEKLSKFWSAPFSGYAWGGKVNSQPVLIFSYSLSAVIGVLVCVGVVLILGKFLSKK